MTLDKQYKLEFLNNHLVELLVIRTYLTEEHLEFCLLNFSIHMKLYHSTGVLYMTCLIFAL